MVSPKSHDEFLGAVFHDRGDLCVAIARQQPGRDGKQVYPADPWPEADAIEMHTHFGVGLHTRTAPGEKGFRRRRETWRGLAVVVLDDVGEEKGGKVIAAPDLVPSFIIETKPGSQQWGYVLDEPLTDYAEADALLQATVDRGICDPGGRNPAHLVRLPGSKPAGKAHAAKLVQWTGQHFSVGQIIEGLGLQPVKAEVLRPGAAAAAAVGEDPVLAWMEATGMVLGHRGDWVDIVCPWLAEHTNEDTGGTGYSPTGEGDAYRSFRCFHRCSGLGRDTAAFLAWVRENGGPDVETIDAEALEKRREELREARAGTMPWETDPILAEHVRKARTDFEAHMNGVVWELMSQGWTEGEIVRLSRAAGLWDAHGAERVTDFIAKVSPGIAAKQDRMRARDVERLQKRRAIDEQVRATSAQWVSQRFMDLAKRMPRAFRASALQWLKDEWS